MSADLTGIENVGEFFSQHYLDELLIGDLKEQRTEWNQSPAKAPPERLRSLSREFFRIMGEAAQLTRPERLYELSHRLQIQIAEALGYAHAPEVIPLGEGRGLPVLHRIDRHAEPYLLVVEGRFHHESEDGALDLELVDAQMGKTSDLVRPRASMSDLFLEVFAAEAPPRWILLISGADLILAERPKWGRGQYLRFDLSEVLGRKDNAALGVTAGLTCRSALVSDGKPPVHDTLDENSHRHAHGVSSDLKFAARKAVELLGNEYVWYQRTTGKKALYSDKAAAELTAECLTYLYRLLFLFYAEARASELRSVPMNADEYRLGYSLEALRDLEIVPLTTPAAQDGYFLHESLLRLFSLVNDGFHGEWSAQHLPGMEHDQETGTYLERGFRIQGLHSPLFDPKHTPRLSSVRLRNKVVQEVIRLLSLTSEGARKRGQATFGRGRISYAQLGINQLGSVYEGLLSYTGFFSKRRLHEVHKAGEDPKDTDQAFFIPETEVTRYSDDERLFTDADGERRSRIYEPGTFIFRLAGRNRESSASYYTPEVLTRCLTRYSLRELLKDKTADEILRLTVCEPALGSGAFVVEALDQLADAYLERKQAELGAQIRPDQYVLEKQRVKTHIATRNCYGVDLNPVAARLAEVSLWLATMHEAQTAPWFGARLGAGNSLVGARVAVWDASDLETDEGLGKAIAKKLRTHGARDDLEQIVEELLQIAQVEAADAVAAVRNVFREHKARATEGPDSGDASSNEDSEGELETNGADGELVDPRTILLKALKKVIEEFKRPRYQRKPATELSLKAVIMGTHGSNSIYHFLLPDPGMSPFDRDKAIKDLMPSAVRTLAEWRKALGNAFTKVDASRLVRLSRQVDELLRERVDERAITLAVGRGPAPVWGQPAETPPPGGWRSIDRRAQANSLARADGRSYARLKRIMDLWAAQWAWPLEHATSLPSRDRWWKAVEEILDLRNDHVQSLAEQLEIASLRSEQIEAVLDDEGSTAINDPVSLAVAKLAPFHWPIEFPEVFAEGGFSLVVGNPPWIRLQWNESDILGDRDPRIQMDSLSSTEVAARRNELLQGDAHDYVAAFESMEGQKAVLGSASNYPLLEGMKPNLYKCFIEHGWRLAAPDGIVGLVHQDGLFDDPGGGRLRAASSVRLRHVYRFQNWLSLFPEVMKTRSFCVSVWANSSGDPSFFAVTNLFHPRTVDECWSHDGEGVVPGIKTLDNHFETRGHRKRIVEIGQRELSLFVELFDAAGTPPARARVPNVHSTDVLQVLRRLADHPRRLRDLGDQDAYGALMWYETKAQEDGTIRRETRFPDGPGEWIVSGPHIYVGTPLYKTPRAGCRTPRDYEPLVVSSLPDDYLPRTNYVPACTERQYTQRTAQFQGVPITDFYRHIHRGMVSLTAERTFVPAIVPPRVAHLHTLVSFAFSSRESLPAISGFWSSICVDFFVRAKGAGHLPPSQSRLLPLPIRRELKPFFAARALRLNCITNLYRDLWDAEWPNCKEGAVWSSDDRRLSAWPARAAKWTRVCASRNAYERRNALVELDALAALELEITVDALCALYANEFPILCKNERDTWFDANGAVAFTADQSLSGIGLSRQQFEHWREALLIGSASPMDFDTKGLLPPFDQCDREADLRRAYRCFADLLKINVKQQDEGSA